jgi:threonine dehydrogenase-like Zn-dependent dehydrogenase
MFEPDFLSLADTDQSRQFGGAAVCVALAMGARVIAMGRSRESLDFLKSRVSAPERVETVQITGDMQADCNELKQFGVIDAFFDIGPPDAYASTHFKSAILALRHGARISIMGGYKEGTLVLRKQKGVTLTNEQTSLFHIMPSCIRI